jgi:glycosyltransferase involved in cell wall biosynthesis
MTTLPSVGVVVPTRNRPELLRRTLAAIGAQDYPGPLRTVVVYDQATPDLSVRAPGVDVLTNRRTAGLAGARNTGILALDTDLVAFCDDDDEWAPDKLSAQVAALEPDSDVTTCAIEVRYQDRLVPRLAGVSWVALDQLVRSRMAMLHASTFLIRRAARLDPDRLGLVAEDAPGSQNEDWDLLLRAARRGPIRHLDRPLVQVRWGVTSHYAYEYPTKISSLRWMMSRHPEISGCRPAAARVYGQLACWSAATGNRSAALRYARAAVRNNWREPRTAIALAAVSRMVRVESVLAALHRRGRGI